MVERLNFGRLQPVIDMPDLIEVQLSSYREFLQKDTAPNRRKPVGLQAVFKEVFPIESYDGRYVLDFVKYEIGEPKLTPQECLDEGQTYAAPLRVTFRLRDGDDVTEDEVYMGEIPLMTEQGSFVINGAERVVVSQLHRSPGICYEQSVHSSGAVLYSFRIIPDRGSWLEVVFDPSDILYVYLDSRRSRRRFLVSTFLRALGYGSDDELLGLYYKFEELKLSPLPKDEDLEGRVLRNDVISADGRSVVATRYTPLSRDLAKQLAAAGERKVQVINISWDDGIFLKTVQKDPTHSEVEALKELYHRLRPGDPPTEANARQLLKRLFFDPKRYDLGRVGRYKLQQKLGLDRSRASRVLEREDLVAAVRYLINLRRGEGSVDDIDHLGTRRVRTIGELLQAQCRVGLARTERLVRERMTIFDTTVEKLTPQKLINPKALAAVIKDFFGRSQLSQFMDQTKIRGA